MLPLGQRKKRKGMPVLDIPVSYGALELASALNSATKRTLVGIFEIAT